MSAATPYIGEIYMFGGNFAPAGWAFCNGQLLPIAENEALFALLGTTYGGDGQQTFALPNLQSRVPLHVGQGPGLANRVLGEVAGVENVTVGFSQMASHSHGITLNASSGPANSTSPAGAVMAVADEARYATVSPGTSLGGNTASLGNSAGGSVPHENVQPFLGVNFIISLFGIFPSPN